MAQLVGRLVWDQDAASSSLATRTKSPESPSGDSGLLHLIERDSKILIAGYQWYPAATSSKTGGFLIFHSPSVGMKKQRVSPLGPKSPSLRKWTWGFCFASSKTRKFQLRHASGLSFRFAEVSVFWLRLFHGGRAWEFRSVFRIFTALLCEFLPKSLLTFPCRYITMKIPIR